MGYTSGMHTSDSARIHELLMAEDDQNVDGIIDFFDEECIVWIPVYDLKLHGTAEVALYYLSMFRAFPDLRNVEVTIYPSTSALFAECLAEGHHQGSWHNFGPTGNLWRSRSLRQFTFTQYGQIRDLTVHVNPADGPFEVGALPSRNTIPFLAMRRPLSGKSALVTGASGGIGAAAATALAQAGADIVLTGRDTASLDHIAQGIDYNTRVGTLYGDLGRPDTCREVVEDAAEFYGSLDIIVNAAGGTLRGPALEMSEDDWDNVQTKNLKSTFFVCQTAAQLMQDHGSGGAIINIASLNAVVGNAWAASYAASKGGVVQLTKSLALEWANIGVRVNALGPGMVETDMTAPLLEDSARYESLINHIPMGRFAKPHEMGGAVVFLASEASAYMTGQTIFVDGGFLSV